MVFSPEHSKGFNSIPNDGILAWEHFLLYTSDPDPALTISSNTYTVHLSYIFSKHSPVCFSQVHDQIPIVMKFFGTERGHENKFLTDLTRK